MILSHGRNGQDRDQQTDYEADENFVFHSITFSTSVISVVRGLSDRSCAYFLPTFLFDRQREAVDAGGEEPA
jgi:hypothetical protein